MITIICSVYEKHDLLELIDYAKKKKIEDCNNDIITPYLLNIELARLNKLKQRINGKVREDYDTASLRYNRNHPSGRVQKDDLPKPIGPYQWKWR